MLTACWEVSAVILDTTCTPTKSPLAAPAIARPMRSRTWADESTELLLQEPAYCARTPHRFHRLPERKSSLTGGLFATSRRVSGHRLVLKDGFCVVEYLFRRALDYALRPRLKHGYISVFVRGIVR
jgi:hypothetical protein